MSGTELIDLVRTTGELATAVGGELRGAGDLPIHGIESVEDAGAEHITFVSDAPHAARLASSKAGAVVVSRGLSISGDRPIIVVDDAELASIRLLELFAPEPDRPEPGIHELAVIHETASIGAGAGIGPFVVVGPEATIGAGSMLHPHVQVGAHAEIGERCELHGRAVVGPRCRLGNDVVLHSGAVIGADGFGYRFDPARGRLAKVPQIGDVRIGDRVEIGANTCIDRAKFGSTVIGDDTKIDNLVQIAHNCRIGRNVVIAGQCGISGSVVIEDGAQLGGNVGVADHLRIGAGARLAAKSGVIGHVGPGETVFGYPAQPHRESLRQAAALRKLPDLLRRLMREADPG